MSTYQERVNKLLTKSPKEAGKALSKMIQSDSSKASRFLAAYASKAASTDQIRTLVLTIGAEADKHPHSITMTINALESAQSVGRAQDRIFPTVEMPITHGNAVRDALAEWRAPHNARAERALAKVEEHPEWYETLTPKKAKAAAEAAIQRNRAAGIV
jgi:hypothetical protein